MAEDGIPEILAEQRLALPARDRAGKPVAATPRLGTSGWLAEQCST